MRTLYKRGREKERKRKCTRRGVREREIEIHVWNQSASRPELVRTQTFLFRPVVSLPVVM